MLGSEVPRPGSPAAARVVVVSDSHLSPSTPEAAAHWDAVVDAVASDPPDLVVHAGDVTADGAVRIGDLAYAYGRVQRLAAVPVPVVLVPGNHDVGDPPGLAGPARPPVTAERLDRFRDLFGGDRFSVAAGRWRVVGVDSQLFNAGDEDEADQWAWLEAEVAAIGVDTPVVVVSHKPLVPGPGDEDRRARYIQPPARERLAALLDRFDARLFVSGHVHQSLRHVVAGRMHVWAPTTWAVLPDAVQPPVGEKQAGIVEITLGDDGGATVAIRRLAGVDTRVIGVDVA